MAMVDLVSRIGVPAMVPVPGARQANEAIFGFSSSQRGPVICSPAVAPQFVLLVVVPERPVMAVQSGPPRPP